jgi:hypothetical protein
MAHDVFISHSVKDKATADAVCAMLESNGIRCWIAPRDVTPGMEWGKCIIDAIRQARIMVLVFTANANASPQIRREIERAVHHDVIVVPLRVENIVPDESLEYFIGNVHWLDALTPPLEAHLKNLAGTIKILLARMSSPTPRSVEVSPVKAATEDAEMPVPAKVGPATDSGPSGKSSAREFGKRQQIVATTPPRKIPVWAWGGAVLALLLIAVFAAVHFVSHPAPVASSQPVTPPIAAPNPVSGFSPPGAPAGPESVPKIAPAKTASPATLGPSVAAKPGANAPEATAGSAPSLGGTMSTIQNELSSIGTVSFTVFLKDKADGSTTQNRYVVQVSNVVTDLAQCRLSYHWKAWQNGAATNEMDSRLSLHDVTGVVVESQVEHLMGSNFYPNKIVSTAPQVMALLLSGSAPDFFLFTDATLANHTAATLKQGVELCGGHLAN